MLKARSLKGIISEVASKLEDYGPPGNEDEGESGSKSRREKT